MGRIGSMTGAGVFAGAEAAGAGVQASWAAASRASVVFSLRSFHHHTRKHTMAMVPSADQGSCGFTGRDPERTPAHRNRLPPSPETTL